MIRYIPARFPLLSGILPASPFRLSWKFRGFRSWAPRALFIALGALTLTACATTGPRSEQLVARAEARWEAIIAGDYDAAYPLYSPGYRATNTRADFEIDMRLRRVGYVSASYREHSCEGDTCTVVFDVEYKVVRPAPGVDEWIGKSVIRETWIRSADQWWFVPPK